MLFRSHAMTDNTPAKLKLGMVGGGQGAFIGEVHRMAARLDDGYQLLAGALSGDADRAAASAAELGIAADRSYENFEAMAKAEAAREDGIEVAGDGREWGGERREGVGRERMGRACSVHSRDRCERFHGKADQVW